MAEIWDIVDEHGRKPGGFMSAAYRITQRFPEETCAFRKADADTILRMMREGKFIPYDFFGDLCGTLGL